MSDSEFKDEIINISKDFEGNIEINRHLSYVAVGDFFVQGEPAADLIKEIDDLVERMNISEKEAAIFIVDNM